MKILALDQSTKITGWALFEDSEIKDYGVLDSNIKENLPLERMKQMYFLIKDLIQKNNPDFVVLEAAQFQKNFSVFGQLSQMQGVIFSLLYEANLGFTVVSPSAWRKFCGVKGRKRAEQKESAIRLVQEKFRIIASEDVCEAILMGVSIVNNMGEVQ